ncbi:MAG: pitrilysin family protein [Pseudomonadota bacterium]
MGRAILTLANGVRVVIDPMAQLKSAAVGVWVRAGATDESDDENGVAHLLEHMAFKGTGRRSAKDIAEAIESVGGHLNAATSYQTTGYYARTLSADVGCAFDILSDIILDPRLEEAELAKEKEVVIQEIGEARDTPDDVLFENIQSLTYRDQALGRPILGGENDVRSHSAATLRRFMDRHYTAENMIVAVSGGVDEDEIEALAKQYFGSMTPQQAPRDSICNRVTSGFHHDPRDLEQTHIAFAVPAVGVRDDDYFAMRLTAEILGGGMSSRLFQTVREKHGLAYSVYAYADAYDDVGTIGVYAGTDADKALQAVDISLTEIAGMARGVTAPELDRARAMLKSSLLMGLESPINRAERSAGQLFTFGRLISEDEICASLDAVTPGDISRCAASLIESAKKSLAVVGPAEFDKLKARLNL